MAKTEKEHGNEVLQLLRFHVPFLLL